MQGTGQAAMQGALTCRPAAHIMRRACTSMVRVRFARWFWRPAWSVTSAGIRGFFFLRGGPSLSVSARVNARAAVS